MRKVYMTKQDLLDLDKERIKEQFCRIAVYDWNENNLIQNIDGYVTGGTINYNGNSVVRRTCSPSIVVPEDETNLINVEDVNNTLSANKKVILYVGFTNTLGAEVNTNKNNTYPESVWVDDEANLASPQKIWFKLGVYLIKSASVSRSTSGLNISLTLSDKMSLLNGDVAGLFPATTKLSEVTEYNESGEYVTTKATIRDIVTTVLRDIGGLVEGRDINYGEVEEAIPDYTMKVVKWGDAEHNLKQTESNGSAFLKVDTTITDKDTLSETFKYGDTVGFIVEPYYWPGEVLTANPGDTITSVLDKIKSLNNYEYFFDIDGKFVWQEKDVYVYGDTDNIDSNTFFNDASEEKDADGIPVYTVNSIVKPRFSEDKKKIAYEFTDADLMVSYSNSPQYNNIKNDIIVWGKRHTAAGSEIPVRYRIQIRKPIKYDSIIDTSVTCVPYITSVASDETYYGYKMGSGNNEITFTFSDDTDWRTLLYFRGVRGSVSEGYNWKTDPLYKDLILEWPKLFKYVGSGDDGLSNFKLRDGLAGDLIDYYCHIVEDSNIGYESLKKWHTKVLNEDSIGAIFTNGVATNYITCVGDNYIKAQENLQSALNYAGVESEGVATINVSKDVYYNLYTTSSTDTNSAFEQARQLLTQCTGYANTISTSAIPIYHLEPNTLIKVRDPKWVLDKNSKKNNAGVEGTLYCINSISLPLAYNGTMTISASKALIMA